MSQSIESQIAELEKRIAALRKMQALQQEIAVLQASLGAGAAAAPATPAKRGRKPKAAAAPAAEAPVKGKPGRKPKAAAAPAAEAPVKGKPGRKPGKAGKKKGTGRRLKEAEAVALLRDAVAAAGKAGISASEAAKASGVFYGRAMGLMPKYFSRSGKGKWTRYTLK